MKLINVYQEILHWSADRPLWQRDALRRIVLNGAITDSDLIDLEYLCCFPHDAVEEIAGIIMASGSVVNSLGQAPQLEAIPLTSHHLPTKLTHALTVAIVRLGKLTNVNKLSPSNAIDFGPSPGLTIIYGDNGSGKSGYARVVRKACRTRGNSIPIQPNVFMNTVSAPPCAEFTLAVNGNNVIVSWKDGQPSDKNLGRILFFDSGCAEHYVQDDSGATFSPAGLDILTMLSRACDSLKVQIANRMRVTQDLINATKKAWTLHDGTKVAIFVTNLSAISDESKVDTLAQWNAKASQRLENVRLLLASNPKQKAEETRAGITRVREFHEKLSFQIAALNDEELTNLQLCHADCLAAEAANVIASQATFDIGYLPGTGGASWRILWEAARAYSTSTAYIDKPFPFLEPGSLCVLCQTPLDSASTQRLKHFEAFIKDQTLKIAEQKRSELVAHKTTLESLYDLKAAYANTKTDLMSLDQSDLDSIQECISDCDARKSFMLQFISSGDSCIATKAPAKPIHHLIKFEAEKEAQAVAEAALHDPDARATLLRESNELEDRLWLHNNGPAVVEQIGRLKKIARLIAAQADTNTTPVTSKTTVLSKAIVTDALCNAFKEEINALGLNTIQVALCSAGGQKGTLRFGVRLPGVESNIVNKVASEGEKRCIAFALFLAELSQSTDMSALVLDDPVSSLDHLHCEHMAKRIALEARKRQVIVFTHNPVFLHDLQTGAEQSAATLHLGYLQWNGDTPGEWNTGLPWNWKSVNDRFDHLRKQQQILAKKVSTQMTEDDQQDVRRVYSLLRSTLERIIETKIFGGAVQRFSNYINVKFVERTVGFTQQEFDELKRLFDRCSGVTEAHDASCGLHKAVPKPQELKVDIEATEKLVDTIMARQNAKKKTPIP